MPHDLWRSLSVAPTLVATKSGSLACIRRGVGVEVVNCGYTHARAGDFLPNPGFIVVPSVRDALMVLSPEQPVLGVPL